MSPLLQPTASKPITYWLPRLEIEPARIALLPVRTQSSLATSWRDTLVGRAAHQVKRLPHLAIGQNVEERRLSKLHRQRLLQRIVKDGIARRVVKVGQHDGVLLGQRRWLERERK